MSFLSAMFGILLFATSVFLILLVLVQRGRGGGLSGALGGMGGQSAFGTKAGDLFTRVTIVAATAWILLCLAAILVLNRQSAAGLGPASETPEFTSAGPSSTDESGDADSKGPGLESPDATGTDATGTEATGTGTGSQATPPAEALPGEAAETADQGSKK